MLNKWWRRQGCHWENAKDQKINVVIVLELKNDFFSIIKAKIGLSSVKFRGEILIKAGYLHGFKVSPQIISTEAKILTIQWRNQIPCLSIRINITNEKQQIIWLWEWYPEKSIENKECGLPSRYAMITSSATAVADQQCTPGGIQDRKQDEVLSALDS